MKSFQEFKSILSESKRNALFDKGDNVKIIRAKDKFEGQTGTVTKVISRFSNHKYKVKPSGHDASFLYNEKDLEKI